MPLAFYHIISPLSSTIIQIYSIMPLYRPQFAPRAHHNCPKLFLNSEGEGNTAEHTPSLLYGSGGSIPRDGRRERHGARELRPARSTGTESERSAATDGTHGATAERDGKRGAEITPDGCTRGAEHRAHRAHPDPEPGPDPRRRAHRAKPPSAPHTPRGAKNAPQAPRTRRPYQHTAPEPPTPTQSAPTAPHAPTPREQFSQYSARLGQFLQYSKMQLIR